jgi:hypothetical protein
MPGRTSVDVSKTDVKVRKKTNCYVATVSAARGTAYHGEGKSPLSALEDAIKNIRDHQKERPGRPNIEHEVALALHFGQLPKVTPK